MWAVRAVPGRPVSVWSPAVVAFVGAMVAFALLTAEAEVAVQLGRWAESPPADRAAVGAEAVSLVARPLVGASLGLLLLLSGLAVAASDTEPVGVHVRAPHPLERFAVVAIVALVAVDGWVWFTMRAALKAAVHGDRELAAAAGLIRSRLGIGVGVGLTILALSAAVGLVRQARRPPAPAGTD